MLKSTKLKKPEQVVETVLGNHFLIPNKSCKMARGQNYNAILV